MFWKMEMNFQENEIEPRKSDILYVFRFKIGTNGDRVLFLFGCEYDLYMPQIEVALI